MLRVKNKSITTYAGDNVSLRVPLYCEGVGVRDWSAVELTFTAKESVEDADEIAVYQAEDLLTIGNDVVIPAAETVTEGFPNDYLLYCDVRGRITATGETFTFANFLWKFRATVAIVVAASVLQPLLDAGMSPNWLTPYASVADGTEAQMIRFKDDPDVACYEGVWLAADKNRFHQERDPALAEPKLYVPNDELWVSAFQESLSGVSVALEYPFPGATVNQAWMCKRGVALITDQHVASCGHAPPGMGELLFPSRVRFWGTDGNTYERNIVGQKYCYGLSTVNVGGVAHANDSWVGTLESPLPPEVIPLRIIPIEFKELTANLWYERLFVTQSIENESASSDQPPAQVASYLVGTWNYPIRHRTMCAMVSADSGLVPINVKYTPWNGDSGMPTFVGKGTELLWTGFTSGGSGGKGPDFYPLVQDAVTITWEALNNQMIADADANAVALGGIGVVTGKTVTVATI